MIEGDAKAWLKARYPAERIERLAQFVDLLTRESERQNLISAATIPEIWSRHIVDSAQLLALVERDPGGLWLDIGSGAGLPGIVIAILRPMPILLVEPRKRRVEFIGSVIATLDLANATVAQARIEMVQSAAAAIISARAVATLPKLLASAQHLSTEHSLWLLPKGISAQSEVAAAEKAWQGSFHVEQSITHPQAQIVVATGVRPR